MLPSGSFLALTAVLVLAVSDGPQGEGALRNTTPLPSDPAAAAALRRGDTALADARAARGSLNAAFDAWREALVLSAPRAAVPCLDPGAPEGLVPDPDGTLARRAESVPGAVLRRLAALPDADRRAFAARAEPEAEGALGAAGRDAARLARVERDFPLTRAAARAALAGADLALERGAASDAAAHLARAREHLALHPDPDPALAAALERRRAAFGAPSGLPAPGPRAATPAAPSLSPLRSLRLESVRRAGLAPLGRDVLPGLAALADGSLVIQTPRALAVLDPAAARGEPEGRYHVEPLDQLLERGAAPVVTAPSTGGWPLLPATDGRRFAAVVGRGAPGRRFRDLPLPARGNVLAVFERAPDELRPRLLWCLGDLGRLTPGSEPPEPGLPVLGPDGAPWPAGFEFQPGPTVQDGGLFVLARRLSDPTAETEAAPGDVPSAGDPSAANPNAGPPPDTLRLFRFDLATGDLVWSTDLTRAAELQDPSARGGSLGLATAAAPLAVADGALVISTNVGLLAAVDAADGRLLWALRNQRREAGGGGWAGSRAPLVEAPGPGLDAGPTVWCAPFDSEFLYALPVRPTARRLVAEGLFAAPPTPRGNALDAAALAPNGALLCAARSGRFAAVERRAGAASALLCLLAEGERLRGRLACAGDLTFVPGDQALRVLDLARGGLVVASAPYEATPGTPAGGDVYVLGDRVAVLGLDNLWLFRLQGD